MARAKRVIHALAAFGKTRQAAALANAAHAVAPLGQYFMRIGLMADIPNDTVIGCVEHIMQSHGQFDHTETGAQMTAGFRHGVNHIGAHIIGQLTQIGFVQLPDIGGAIYPVE